MLHPLVTQKDLETMVGLLATGLHIGPRPVLLGRFRVTKETVDSNTNWPLGINNLASECDKSKVQGYLDRKKYLEWEREGNLVNVHYFEFYDEKRMIWL